MEEEKQRLQEEAINLKESLSEALLNLEMESAEDITSIATASASLTSNANQVYKRDSLVNILDYVPQSFSSYLNFAEIFR